MKREYRKPVFYTESFTLANHISAGCAARASFGNTCPITDGEVVFFTSSEIGCNEDGMTLLSGFSHKDAAETTIEDLINMSPTCYNSFTDYSLLFNS